MNKLIITITLVTFMFAGQCVSLFSQQDTQIKKDTAIIVGGIYKILMADGRELTGEIISTSDSTVSINALNEIYILNKDKIMAIGIPDLTTYDSDENFNYSDYDLTRFKMIGSVQAGISIPAGNFGNRYSSGSGFQLSAYTFFGRSAGIGGEIQHNSFHGLVYYDVYPYSYVKTEENNYNQWLIKLNLILGNLNPESKIVIYGLAGLGLQINSTGGYTSTLVYSNESFSSKAENYSGSDFQYGFGAGSFYKISKKLGINLEFQYNNGAIDFYTIRAGLMYTNF